MHQGSELGFLISHLLPIQVPLQPLLLQGEKSIMTSGPTVVVFSFVTFLLEPCCPSGESGYRRVAGGRVRYKMVTYTIAQWFSSLFPTIDRLCVCFWCARKGAELTYAHAHVTLGEGPLVCMHTTCSQGVKHACVHAQNSTCRGTCVHVHSTHREGGMCICTTALTGWALVGG